MSLTTQFDIQKRLAVGNSGLIYHALEKQTGLPVALKLLVGSGDIPHPLDVCALMRAWPRLRLVSGSHVAQLLDVITDEGETVLVYPYGDGPSLLDLPSERVLEKDEVVDLAAQLIAALRPGERMNWAHGDLKPSNVVVTRSDDGRPFLLVLDWGLSAFRAKISEDSLPFTAPERLAGGPATIRADLYSAGAILHFLLTAQPAADAPRGAGAPLTWPGANPDLLKQLRPDLPAKLVDWLKWLLDARPKKRPASVAAARDAMASLKPPPPPAVPRALHTRTGTPAQVSPSVEEVSSPGPNAASAKPELAARPAGRVKRQGLAITLALACLAGGSAGWWYFGSRPARTESHEAAPPITVAATPHPRAAIPATWAEIREIAPPAASPPPLAAAAAPPPSKTTSAAVQPQAGSAPKKIAAALPPIAGKPPAGAWRDAEIGDPAIAGKSAYDQQSGVWTIRGGGAGFGGVSDQIHLTTERFASDGSIAAKVTRVEKTGDHAKAGVIFRDSGAPGAGFASVTAKPDGRATFRWRSTPDTATQQSETGPGTLPVWLKITRTGNSFTGYMHRDGEPWTRIAPPETIAMNAEVEAGLCATAHDNAALASATLTRLSLLPGDLSAVDIGHPDLPGDATRQPGNVWIVHGAGADIWFAADQFCFVCRDATGDETLTAQVTEIRRTDQWAKAGLMFRAGTEPNAAYADVIATPDSGVSFQWRPADGAQSQTSQTPGIPLPVWLRLTRKGSQFWAYFSKDGVHWTPIDANPSLQIKAPLKAGFCVTSHDKAQITTAIFKQ